jgi:dolichol kinase
LAVLVVLELARVIKLWPVHEALEMSVQSFIDEQDAGNIALTPLYLLIGCSLPFWIHNSPCDLIGSTSFEFLPLISGILSVGIGDTFASVIGSKIGRHKWGNSIKSVEGTIASIVAQGLFIYGLYAIDFLQLDLKLAALCGIAVISNALIETFIHQVDNLVLPILTYIILMYK